MREQWFQVNPTEGRVGHAYERQSVTRIVVNQRTDGARTEYYQLMGALRDARRSAPAASNRNGEPDFRVRLVGRISCIAPHTRTAVRGFARAPTPST